MSVGHDVVVAMVARGLVDVGVAPGIIGYGLAQVRAVPFWLIHGAHHERRQTLLGVWIMAGIEAIFVQCLSKPDDLRFGSLDFRFSDLRKVFGADVGRQQPNNY